jgi:hypothetical protein
MTFDYCAPAELFMTKRKAFCQGRRGHPVRGGRVSCNPYAWRVDAGRGQALDTEEIHCLYERN